MRNAEEHTSETESLSPYRVTLARIELVPGCTTGVGVGLDAAGDEVTFAVDWRPCLALAEAVAVGPVQVYLKDLRVIAWRRP